MPWKEGILGLRDDSRVEGLLNECEDLGLAQQECQAIPGTAQVNWLAGLVESASSGCK